MPIGPSAHSLGIPIWVLGKNLGKILTQKIPT